MSRNKDKKAKEDDVMNANALQRRRLDFSKISNRIVGTLSSEEALKDITPMQWSEDILSGKKKAIITKENHME